ncbi:MAG: M1 family aminopeptidase, partial [Anaerolineales bacterium]
ARNFGFSISPSYLVLENDLNGIQVLGYIFPGYQVPGQAAFNATVEALDLYQRLYGPYQQSSLTMVQADFNHGVEYEGMYFLSRGFFDSYTGTDQSYLVAIAVHETAHQWWYGQVANDQALEPWLDEALCTFSELAYYEQLHPESTAWWWAVRVDFYQPVGRLDRSIYDFTQYADQYLEYRNATYLQGAKFLSQLKSVLGEADFYSFLRTYAELYQDEIATGADFFDLLGQYLDVGTQEWLLEYFPDLNSP